MSLSKLESLPNEILADLIEKYINGVDIIIAFNYQLNQRFDRLIAQCHRLRFNFIRCPMDNFRICMGLLPAYIDKIEELAISDDGAPGQVHAFLSLFPYFIRFKRLRKLYIYVASKSVDWDLMQRVLVSLSGTSIDSLSIEAEDVFAQSDAWKRILSSHLPSKTLRKLCLLISLQWDNLPNIPSNIEYFIAPNLRCETQALQYLLRWPVHLKYLHISLFDLNTPQSNMKSNSTNGCQSLPQSALRTLILNYVDPSITVDALTPYFKIMPLLNRLDMTVSSTLLDANAWELLLMTSLPALKQFILRTTKSELNGIEMENVRASFQNISSRLKTNFCLIITRNLHHHPVIWNRCFSNRSGYTSERSPTPYLIIPDRSVDENTITVDEHITSLFSPCIDTLPQHYYYKNVKYLGVCNFEQSTLNWILSHVNCAHISELVLTYSPEYTEELARLLVSTRTKTSLYIDFRTLFAYKKALINEESRLKRLDISFSRHPFKEEDIRAIAQLFPHLEHLLINTADLQNIPFLKIYFPYLNSLSYNVQYDGGSNNYILYGRIYHSTPFALATDFFYRCQYDQVTIWLDHRVYEHPYWKKFDVKPQEQTITTVNTPTPRERTTLQKLLSFLKISKK